MDIRIQPLEPDCYYHIYNRGINSTKIFENDENYNYFLNQFSNYVLTVSDVLAYCLMPNHFHCIIEIIKHQEGGKTPPLLEPTLPQQAANLFAQTHLTFGRDNF